MTLDLVGGLGRAGRAVQIAAPESSITLTRWDRTPWTSHPGTPARAGPLAPSARSEQVLGRSRTAR
jgi:hypothetical protein